MVFFTRLAQRTGESIVLIADDGGEMERAYILSVPGMKIRALQRAIGKKPVTLSEFGTVLHRRFGTFTVEMAKAWLEANASAPRRCA